jgi:N-acetyl-anhydromuramyl-L-alanine amidase AmpD
LTYTLPNPIPFIKARHFTPGRIAPIRFVVLHSMENPDRPGNAIGVANWFSKPCSVKSCDLCPEPDTIRLPGPRTSAHFMVDDKEVIQSVKDEDTAWAAPGANANGIHIEMAGKAGQTAEEWMDPYSRAVIDRVIVLAADLCVKHSITPQFLGAARLKMAHLTGITTHAEVSAAFKKSSHWDPGPNFPARWLAEKVAQVVHG